ncbi:serine hydrolase domain-containing protein [Paenibacillus aurantius]|uniref:Serine hydrolase domain-containing protein n=1 Tax=Paenibacillus aurantius TaxID=2918900 RepID=A0AA96LI14_9BACL|nr:serine hydrolase domain-containing protein [Paenibacillus aurantius]WNQ13353.1 serine hydrolase domain-containing protein [Paenibacillus aurantius]
MGESVDGLPDSGKLLTAFRLLDGEIRNGQTPGGTAAAGSRTAIYGLYAAGSVGGGTEAGRPVVPETIYDCASLTKVVVTLPLVLMLLEEGKLHLNEPVCRFLPEFGANGKESVTVRQLLSHTSGLPAFFNLHGNGWPPERMWQEIAELRLEDVPGSRMVYSDIGFIVLGRLIAVLMKKPLDQAARERLFQPLGMTDTGFCPGPELHARLAPTEFDEKLGRPKLGEVHDENAYAFGGVSGHAGLFSTAGDLAKYARMWLGGGELDGTRVLSPASVEAAARSWTGTLPANRGLGWTLKGDPWDASGDLFSERSYGHTGFTGTSLWIDPQRDVFAVLLTNRVHYGRDKSVVRLRVCYHNAVAASLS